MLVVKKTDCILSENKVVAEASDVGLPVGHSLPDFVAVVDETGSGMLFGPCRREEQVYGDTLAWIWSSRDGSAEFHLLND